MPIPLQDLEKAAAKGTVILDDRPCRSCGYNLVGLHTKQNCPECGKPIAGPKDIPRYADQMVNAPMRWLKSFNFACTMLCFGVFGMTLAAIAWLVIAQAIAGLVFACIGLIWALGVWVAVAPRPKTKVMVTDPAREWRFLRVWARVSQFVWPVVGVLGASAQVSSGTLRIGLSAAAVACAVLGMVGWWPTAVILSNLAYWASDTDLADQLRTVSWVTAVGIVGSVAYITLFQIGTFGGFFGGILVLVAWSGGIILPLGYGLFAIWKLWRLSHWVLMNHVTAAARDDRLRAKASRSVVESAKGFSDP